MVFLFSLFKAGLILNLQMSFTKKIITSQYNDFVPPNRTALRCFEESENSLLKKALFTEIHVGQYIVHGVYENGLYGF